MTRIGSCIWFCLCLTLLGCVDMLERDALQGEASKFLRANTWIEQLDQGVPEHDIVIQGSVTSSDSCGNFYQSLFIQDITGALELRLAFYDTYVIYAPGEIVSVKLRGVPLERINGTLGATIGGFNIAATRIVRQGAGLRLQPRRVTIEQIDSTLLGQYVEIAGGGFTQAGKQIWSSERSYTVPGSRSALIVYTSPYATFANELLPVGMIRIRGILTRYKDQIQLKLSSPEDAIVQ